MRLENEQQINQLIQQEISEKFEKPYDGEATIPPNIIEVFKNILFKVPPDHHRLHTKRIKELLSKSYLELTRIEIGIMLKAIMSASYSEIYGSLEEALQHHEAFESLAMQFNKESTIIEHQIVTRRNALMRMAGLDPRAAKELLMYPKI